MKVNVSDDGRVDGCLYMMMVKLKAIFARFLSTFFLLFTTRDIFYDLFSAFPSRSMNTDDKLDLECPL